MTPGWLATAADEFWSRVGTPPPTPRNLDLVLDYALPVSLVVLPSLAVSTVEAWLHRHHGRFAFETTPRALRGCLLAFQGQGFIFVDEDDDPAEQRFTLAHEIAHYLLDYHAPREDALRRLGPTVLPVLNGERLPRLVERIDAALTATSLVYYVHLFDRSRADATVDASERRADELACELLAPASELEAAFGPEATVWDVRAALMDTYGFPGSAANAYARSWLRQHRPAPTDFGWLRR